MRQTKPILLDEGSECLILRVAPSYLANHASEITKMTILCWFAFVLVLLRTGYRFEVRHHLLDLTWIVVLTVVTTCATVYYWVRYKTGVSIELSRSKDAVIRNGRRVTSLGTIRQVIVISTPRKSMALRNIAPIRLPKLCLIDRGGRHLILFDSAIGTSLFGSPRELTSNSLFLDEELARVGQVIAKFLGVELKLNA